MASGVKRPNYYLTHLGSHAQDPFSIKFPSSTVVNCPFTPFPLPALACNSRAQAQRLDGHRHLCSPSCPHSCAEDQVQ